MELILKPIGYIESEFKNAADIPRQSIYAFDKTARVRLLDEYAAGALGLRAGMDIIIVFYIHKAGEYSLVQKSDHFEGCKGVFACRTPRRPNHIGLSKVKIVQMEQTAITFQGVDMLDGTPVLDIKPAIGTEY